MALTKEQVDQLGYQFFETPAQPGYNLEYAAVGPSGTVQKLDSGSADYLKSIGVTLTPNTRNEAGPLSKYSTSGGANVNTNYLQGLYNQIGVQQTAQGEQARVNALNQANGNYVGAPQVGTAQTSATLDATGAAARNALAVPQGSAAAALQPSLGQNVTEGATPGSIVPNTSSGAAAVDVSQPNPASVQAQPYTDPSLYKVDTQGIGPDGKPIYDIFAGDQHISDPNDPRLKGVNLTTLPGGKAPTGFQSKFQQGFNEANAAGVTGGSSTVSEYTEPRGNETANSFLQTDPILGQLVAQAQQYFSPQNQRASLSDTYNKLLKDSGVQAIDMELVNMKNIIEGSEDDIRNEVTKAGGFATDSQVLALTNARNKQLIKNYNTLLDTRNAKEKYLQTSLQLEQADREAADQKFNSMMNVGMQLAQYQQQMQQNARQQMQWYVGQVGFDGLYNSTKGDPYYVGLAEQTLGLPKGGLTSASNQAKEAKALAQQEQSLNLQVKQSQLLTDEYQRKKILSDISTSGKSTNYTPEEIYAYAQQYASTGAIPTGLPKGSFGLVSNIAKEIPKSPGQILDRVTGITPDKLGAAGDAYGALYSAVELAGQLKELDNQRWGGLVAGTLGKITGSENQQKYVDLKGQIVDLIARARSGAALTPSEEQRYSDMLPGRFNNPLGFGTDSQVKIDNFISALTSDLTNKTNSKGWVINGFTPVQVNGQTYKVGDVVQNSTGQMGRINTDGSITVIK